MKKLLAACGIAAALAWAAPVRAEVRVEQIQSNATASGTNIRVSLANDGQQTESLALVELQARENSNSAWKTVKAWARPLRIEANQRVTLDFLPLSEVFGDPTLAKGQYELRVVATDEQGGVVASAVHLVPMDTSADR